ncbi:MAG: GNAT family N-acetyltransferase [Actinomycetota bacterium]|nr:GNAT family N-acetyltransferase [Actinomycetota bacterium]
MPAVEPLADLLQRAARGHPPPADGNVRCLPSPAGRSDAVVALTAHSIVATSAVSEEVVHRHLATDDLGAALKPPFLTWLGRRLGSTPGNLDAVLAAGALGGEAPVVLTPMPAAHHPRVERARDQREDVEAWCTPDRAGVLTLGRGLAGRIELAFEVAPPARGQGLGRELVRAARHLAPEGEIVFAQVAPGNVASMRAVLAAGFIPLGAEVLFPRP